MSNQYCLMAKGRQVATVISSELEKGATLAETILVCRDHEHPGQRDVEYTYALVFNKKVKQLKEQTADQFRESESEEETMNQFYKLEGSLIE